METSLFSQPEISKDASIVACLAVTEQQLNDEARSLLNADCQFFRQPHLQKCRQDLRHRWPEGWRYYMKSWCTLLHMLIAGRRYADSSSALPEKEALRDHVRCRYWHDRCLVTIESGVVRNWAHQDMPSLVRHHPCRTITSCCDLSFHSSHSSLPGSYTREGTEALKIWNESYEHDSVWMLLNHNLRFWISRSMKI